MYTLFRDDDISKYTDMTLMREVHQLFIDNKKIHTVSVEVEGLWDNKLVWYWLMTAPNLQIGLHGWNHSDYSVMAITDIIDHFQRSYRYWSERIAGGGYEKRDFVAFYPPWNKVGNGLRMVCEEYKLPLDNRVGGEVYNFHWWTMHDDKRKAALQSALSAR